LTVYNGDETPVKIDSFYCFNFFNKLEITIPKGAQLFGRGHGVGAYGPVCNRF